MKKNERDDNFIPPPLPKNSKEREYLSPEIRGASKAKWFIIPLVLIVLIIIISIVLMITLKKNNYSEAISESSLSQNETNETHELIGSKILFGDYVWRVLDVKDNKAFIITEDIIELRPYDKSDKPNTWEFCSLRHYLNEMFYNSFSEEEKQYIVETTIHNSQIQYSQNGSSEFSVGGNDTTDKIFLLSSDEFENYEEILKDSQAKYGFRKKDWMHEWQEWLKWLNDHSDKNRHYDTELSFEASISDIEQLDGKEGSWWLRSPYIDNDGQLTNEGSIVNAEGNMSHTRHLGYSFFAGLENNTYIMGPYAGVRPVCWIELNANYSTDLTLQTDIDDKDDLSSHSAENTSEIPEESPSESLIYSEDVHPDDLYDWSSSILPFSSDRLLTYDDISYLSREQLILARNEIYARHGRIFKVDWIREYFEAQPWYYGTLTEEEFSSDLFSDIEMKNIMFIKEYESMLDG